MQEIGTDLIKDEKLTDVFEVPEFAKFEEEIGATTQVMAEDAKDVNNNHEETIESASDAADNNHQGGSLMTCKPCQEQGLLVEELEIGATEEANQAVQCNTGGNPNCSECCSIFTDTTKRERFGYQLTNVACECHDICVQDVRDICVKERTLTQIIPCRPDGSAGCRGGMLPGLPPNFQFPTVRSWRVLCAEECLRPDTNCDRITNEVEFEVVISYGENCFGVVTPSDTFDCFFHEFARFPSGVRFPNNQTGFNQWRNELAFIDGSCKVIIVENVRVVADGNNCVLVIDYKVIDKLWKHENLLVSAIRPYFNTPESSPSVTIKQEFEQGHHIGPCPGGPCGM